MKEVVFGCDVEQLRGTVMHVDFGLRFHLRAHQRLPLLRGCGTVSCESKVFIKKLNKFKEYCSSFPSDLPLFVSVNLIISNFSSVGSTFVFLFHIYE